MQVDVVLLERGDDFGRPDAAVQVAVFGGVGLDRDALLGDLGRLLPQVGLVGLLDRLQLRPVLVDHPLVMVAGHRRQAVRDEIVEA